MLSAEDALIEAIATGEIIFIKYHGGSKPGMARQMSPLSVDNGNVKAKCIESGQTKTFKISKIEFCNSDIMSVYCPEIIVTDSANLRDTINLHKSKIEAYGWILVLEDKFVGLYSRFKNGNIKKSPDISIEYEEMIYDYSEFDEDGNEIEVLKPRTRPWIFKGRSLKSSNYKNLSSVVEVFLEDMQVTAKNNLA